MASLQLRIHSSRWEGADLDDDALGEHLVGLVRDNLGAGGRAPGVALAVRRGEIDLLPLDSVREAGIPMERFLAALTRARFEDRAPVDAVGLLGSFTARAARPGARPSAPVVMAFLEWTDCRWWQWRALVDADYQLLAESETRRAAIEGDAKPRGLGGWWSLGRRARPSMDLRRVRPERPPVQEHAVVQ